MSHGLEQKTIAKNTIFLYLRMFVVMFVSLFTSRVVLDKLGVDDYGIYNIVGSIVVSFAFVKNSLMSATQRYMSYEKGKEDGSCSAAFTCSVLMHVGLIVIVILILETVGLWMFYNVLQIPIDRQHIAFYVYQISVATFAINLLQVPYSALIVSCERMSVYALLSIVDVVFKLVIVYLLTVAEAIDRLLLYSLLIFGVTMVCNIITMLYCHVSINEDCKFIKSFNRSMFRSLLGFSSWNLLGGISGVASTEGPNFFMNYYLGVKVNAAMGIAKQVSNAVYSFSANFQTAFNPQIVKSYASKEFDYMFDLVFRASKLSFLLVFIIALPLTICCNEVLNVWLTVVPEYTGIFCSCILIAQFVSAISSPFWMAAHAIGNIKKYQFVLVFFNVLVLPISWIVLSCGFEPYYILASQIFINIGVLIYRVYYLKIKVNFPARLFYREVVFKCCCVLPVVCVPIIYIISTYFAGFAKIIITTMTSALLTGLSFYFFGLNSGEKQFVRNLLAKRLGK